jgi:hypothetical protein
MDNNINSNNHLGCPVKFIKFSPIGRFCIWLQGRVAPSSRRRDKPSPPACLPHRPAKFEGAYAMTDRFVFELLLQEIFPRTVMAKSQQPKANSHLPNDRTK